MQDHFQTIIRRVVGCGDGPALSGISAPSLFETTGDEPTARLARINGAFLLSLCGGDEADAARTLLQQESAEGCAQAKFLIRLSQWVLAEQDELPDRDPDAARSRQQSAAWAADSTDSGWDESAQAAVWQFLFPEGYSSLENPDQVVADLRARRTVSVDQPNPQPIVDPISEMLVTSNVLLTMPADLTAIADLPLSASLRDRIESIAGEEQKYWFDHPIPLDIETEANEIIYGLSGLNEAVGFEKARANIPADARMSCALSVSVTHPSLKTVARDYIQEALSAAPDMPHLDVYVFTESATDQLIDDVLAPAIEHYLDGRDVAQLRRVLGVDGEYGRHYSFLKAVSALWHVLVNPHVRATFKIDLDQIFPQQRLVEEGGGSAFEHFQSPLWGARGHDAEGRPVELGMLAGALVNEKDITHGLFTPDVTRPSSIPAGEAVTFFNRLPMALSTEAEMMTVYDGNAGNPDGQNTCLQRIHVTGGTNGIRVDALRRHRPFTPTFIGRAEDQAYLLSVIFKAEAPLRYLHSAGLIMRHDKEAFAGLAIEAAKVGRFIGDLARTLYFSHYVQALPWPDGQVKQMIDPFTGCFASRIPTTLVAMRMALKVGELLAGDDEDRAEALDVMEMAAQRLEPLIERLTETPQALADDLAAERAGWEMFYDALDALENGIADGDQKAFQLREAARSVIQSCQVSAGAN